MDPPPPRGTKAGGRVAMTDDEDLEGGTRAVTVAGRRAEESSAERRKRIMTLVHYTCASATATSGLELLCGGTAETVEESRRKNDQRRRTGRVLILVSACFVNTALVARCVALLRWRIFCHDVFSSAAAARGRAAGQAQWHKAQASQQKCGKRRVLARVDRPHTTPHTNCTRTL